MGGPRIERLRADLRAVCEADPTIRLVLLFGSEARGNPRKGSDIDLAIRFTGEAPDLLELSRRLSLATGREVDVVDLLDVGYPLLKRVVEEGTVVHEARPGEAATWRARALTTLDLDAAWFHRMRDAYLGKLVEGGSDG